jgi:hypothetical protein
MSAVVRRWIRAWCATCRERTVFEARPGWVFVCSKCSRGEQRLAPNGLLASA